VRNPIDLRLLRLRRRKRPGLRRGRRSPRTRHGGGGRRARLWRRQCRIDGRGGARGPERRRPRHWNHSRVPEIARADAGRRPGDDRGSRHAQPQAPDVRARRRLCGAAGRRRHAGGVGRADDLGAARPAPQADPDAEHRGVLEAAPGALRPYARVRLHPPRAGAELPRRRTRRGGDTDAQRRCLARTAGTRQSGAPRGPFL
ncbi:MAG: Lysine decarboxylase family, partial [uncultured Microvirga sp.]